MKMITSGLWLLPLSGVAEAYLDFQTNNDDVRSAYDEFCDLKLSLSCRSEHGIPCDQLGLRSSSCIESIFWHLTITNTGPSVMTVSRLDLSFHDARTLALVLSLPVNPIFPEVTTGMSPREDVNLCTSGIYSAALATDATAGHATCSGTATYNFTIRSNDPPPNPVPLVLQPTPVQPVAVPVPVPVTSPKSPPPGTCQVACPPGFICSTAGTSCLQIDVPVSAPVLVPTVAPNPTSPSIAAPFAEPTSSACSNPDPPCLNGQCFDDSQAQDGYRCICEEGWTGPYCGIDTSMDFQLCPENLPVSVSVGPNSNPAGGFVNVAEQQSLQNVVNCLDPDQGEQHTQASHVWWNPSPLELLFEFDQPYYLTDLLFWNYFGETYDVDEIVFEFKNSNGAVVATRTVSPSTGQNAAGVNANNIIAERIDLGISAFAVQFVTATLNGSNGQLDFQNMVFLGVN